MCEIIVNDREYKEIMKEMKENNYSTDNILKLFDEIDDESDKFGGFSCYDIACAIMYFATLLEKLQKENRKLKQEQAKRNWIRVKENGEVVPMFYISKDKIRNVFDTKIYNFNYLSKTDWDETQRCIDDGIVNILKTILQELLEEEK